ncbi:MAG TPA: transketolase [Micromonosporaceae bacterium]
METMRDRFLAMVGDLLDADPRLMVILAAVSAAQLEGTQVRHPRRIVNLGIREQLLISATGGAALAGMRPIAHSFASFLIERPFEQIKVDLTHQGIGAVLVSAGASYDIASGGRTHHCPGDVALIDTLPGWSVHVPGHPDEAQTALEAATRGDDLAYVRLSTQANASPLRHASSGFDVLRTGGAGTVIAVGPVADAVLAATSGMDVTVLYAVTIRPFDGATLRRTLAAPSVVVVEPYLGGTSVPYVTEVLADLPHRVLGLGVRRADLRRYGVAADHQRAHGLDPASLRTRIAAFLA